MLKEYLLKRHDKVTDGIAWLANETGLSVSAITKLVYNERSPSLMTAVVIVEATKGEISLDDFIEQAKEKEKEK